MIWNAINSDIIKMVRLNWDEKHYDIKTLAQFWVDSLRARLIMSLFQLAFTLNRDFWRVHHSFFTTLVVGK